MFKENDNNVNKINKDNNDNDLKLKKKEKCLYTKEINFKKYKFIKSKSSLNWKFVKYREKEEEEKEETSKINKEEINKNTKEEINNNEKEKEKNNTYIVSIRRSYKKKKKNNSNNNILINRTNNINKYNIHTENNNKNEEEKNMNIFSFKRKYTEKIENKINKEQFNNNEKINQIINDNKIKLSKMANKFEDINNKRVHIRMFYKLKNSSLKNGKKYNYA